MFFIYDCHEIFTEIIFLEMTIEYFFHCVK